MPFKSLYLPHYCGTDGCTFLWRREGAGGPWGASAAQTYQWGPQWGYLSPVWSRLAFKAIERMAEPAGRRFPAPWTAVEPEEAFRI